jgi:esterase/lipase superfamily enzyme
MVRRILVALVAWALFAPVMSPAGAQPTLEPGQGRLVRVAMEVLEPAQETVVFDGLASAGRVRGLRLIPRLGSVIVIRVVIHYTNGQVHVEEREIVMADGERSRLIDPRFEERRIDRVEVTFKPGRRSATVHLELWAPQSEEAIAEARPKAAKKAKKKSGRTRSFGAQPKAAPPARMEMAPAVDDSSYTGVPIFYGTDRRKLADRTTSDNRVLATYGLEPGRKLELGRAIVTVPKARKPGTIPLPDIDAIILQIPYGVEDRARHFTVLRVDALDPGRFAADARAHLDQASRYRGRAFVFVHGFNVSFEDALFRAAQITYDMGFDGLPIIYSWPSQGRPAAYQVDRERAVSSAEWLVDLLALVSRETGVGEINVIAHSTGGFVLLETLKHIQRNPPAAIEGKLGHMIFAAPDVLREDFKGDAERLRGIGRSMTLYASSGDWALWFSGILRAGLNPAGAIPRNGAPVLAQGVDSIDVSKLDTSYFALNHTAFGDHEPLIRDMGTLISSGLRPPSRRDANFRQRNDPQSGGVYWRYEAAQ